MVTVVTHNTRRRNLLASIVQWCSTQVILQLCGGSILLHNILCNTKVSIPAWEEQNNSSEYTHMQMIHCVCGWWFTACADHRYTIVLNALNEHNMKASYHWRWPLCKTFGWLVFNTYTLHWASQVHNRVASYHWGLYKGNSIFCQNL